MIDFLDIKCPLPFQKNTKKNVLVKFVYEIKNFVY